MKKRFHGVLAIVLLPVALAAFSSCNEKVETGGSSSSFVFTDESDMITSSSARLHAHYKGTKIEGDNVGIICDKEGKLDTKTSPRETSVVGEDGTFYVTFFDLTPVTVYEYMAYALVEGKEYYGKKKTFKTEGVPVTQVIVTPSEITIFMEDNTTASISVIAKPDNASDRRVELKSSDASVASVSAAGVITAKKGGTATITATSVQNPSVSGTCKVTVKEAPPQGAVDMGLPSGRYWRRLNLGAGSETAGGEYYAWGEIYTKSNFTKEGYKFYDSSKMVYSKYSGNGGYNTDGHTRFYEYEYADDAARQKLKGSWRVPSNADWEELKNNCTLSWGKISGIYGFIFTAKNPDRKGNKNQLFFPQGGYKNGTTMTYKYQTEYPEQGYYWMDQSKCYNDGYSWNDQNAYNLNFRHDTYGNLEHAFIDICRYYGAMIRPVCD